MQEISFVHCTRPGKPKSDVPGLDSGGFKNHCVLSAPKPCTSSTAGRVQEESGVTINRENAFTSIRLLVLFDLFIRFQHRYFNEYTH